MSIEILSTLEEVDFPPEQARAITKIFEQDYQHLAKKEDIRYLEKDIKSIRSDIKSIQGDIKQMATKEDMRLMATKEDMKLMATKEDLMATNAEIAKIKVEKSKIKVEISNVKYDLIKWVVGGIILSGFFQMLFKYLLNL